MKKIIINSTLFGLISTIAITLLVLLTSQYAINSFNARIDSSKNILILGNSHPECALDDTILPNVRNLAQSGSAYYYDYVKAKELFQKNDHIDTLVIGYSYGDLAEKMDAWFTDDYRIKHKIRNHLFLFDFDDYLSLLKGNPKSVLTHTPQTIFHNLKIPSYGLSGLGGFKSLKRNKIEEDKKRLFKNPTKSNTKISTYQAEYLLKIYELCKSKKVQLMLLATPIHPVKIKDQHDLITEYQNFANEQLPEAILIDDSNLKLPDAYFADLSHLNEKGAKFYSNFFKKRKITQTQKTTKPIQ